MVVLIALLLCVLFLNKFLVDCHHPIPNQELKALLFIFFLIWFNLSSEIEQDL